MSTERCDDTGAACLRRAEVAGFTLIEGVHAAGSSLPWHRHDGPTVCYVLNGSFTEVSGGTALTCGPSTLKFMPAGEKHCDRFDRGATRGLLIEVDPSRLGSIQPFCGVLDRRVHFQGGPTAGIARRMYQEFRATDTAAPLAVEGLLLQLLATASRQETAPYRGATPGWLIEARDIIHADFARRPTLGTIARVVGVHPATLARAFRRAYGCSIGGYIRRLRIERAAHELGESDSSLAQIALAAGFADQSHFSNLFRRHTGVSPARYRRSVRVS